MTLGVVLGLVTNIVCLLLIALLFKDKFLDEPLPQPQPQPQSKPYPQPQTGKNEGQREWIGPQLARSSSYSSSLHFMSPKRVKRICVTGGPCGGKTTAMTRITERVRELGMKVYVVPEAATMLMKGGAMINMEEFTRVQKVRFQAKILKLQVILEDVFTDLCDSSLSTAETALVLCDRGVMDGSAYMEPDLWQALVDEMGFSVVHLRDRRYDAVVHMVTAANGAEESYNLASNEARYEGLNDARIVDSLIQKAWTGHPNFTIVDNHYPSFDAKLLKSVEQVCKNLGLPAPTQNYYKYLIVGNPEVPTDLPKQTLFIEETFLLSSEKLIARISRRGQEGSHTYSYSEIEKETRKTLSKNQLSSREFMTLLDKADPRRKTLKRKRQCFVWKSQYFALDTFDVWNGITLIRIETENEPVVPDFLQVAREVTHEQAYSSLVLSKVMYYVQDEDKGFIEEKTPQEPLVSVEAFSSVGPTELSEPASLEHSELHEPSIPSTP